MKRFAFALISIVAATLMSPAAAQDNGLFGQVLKGLAKQIITEGARAPAPQPAKPTPAQRTVPANRMSRAEIIEIQSLLTDLGYDPGGIDGQFGRNTARAIRSFQIANGWMGDGKPSDLLLVRLRDAKAQAPTGPTTTASARFSPSFDCARAGNPAERAICGSAELAALDQRLADVYRLTLDEVANPEAVRTEQKDWIAKRNRCGGDETCLRYVMRIRTAALNKTRDAAANPAPVARTSTTQTVTTEPAPSTAPHQIDRGLYIIKPDNLKPGRGSYVVVPACLSRDEIPAVDGAVDAAIGADALIVQRSFDARDMTGFLDYDDTYLLLAGDCLEKFKIAAEDWNDGVAPDLNIVTVMEPRTTDAAPTSVDASQKGLDLQASSEILPILRLYLPQYLANSSAENRITILEKYVGELQRSGDHVDEQVFSKSEIQGRDVKFFANQNLDRWDAALKALEIQPPVTVKARVNLYNYQYDFAKQALVFPNLKQDNRDGVSHLFAPVFRNGHIYYSANGFQRVPKNRENYLLNVLAKSVMPFASIETDRKALLPEIPMSAEQAERYKLGNVRVFADIFYRIDAVGPKTDKGEVFYKGALQGIEVFTDTGDRLASYAPQDLPLATYEEPKAPAPAPEPVQPTADASGFTVAGIGLGMNREAAQKAVGQIANVAYHFSFAPREAVDIDQLADGFALANGEFVTLQFDPTAEPPALIAMTRSIPVPKGVPADKVRDSLVAAYGVPTSSETGGENEWDWRGDRNGACTNVLQLDQGTMYGGKIDNRSGTLDDVPDPSGRDAKMTADVFLMDYLYFLDLVRQVPGTPVPDDCTPTFHASYAESQTSQSRLQLQLFDPQAFIAAAAAAENAKPEPSFEVKLK